MRILYFVYTVVVEGLKSHSDVPYRKSNFMICVTTQYRLRGLKTEDVACELEQLQQHINMVTYGRIFYRRTQDEACPVMQRCTREGGILNLGHVF